MTAAKNEAAHIEATLEAVVSQSLLPTKWVIVSDGSQDLTDAIVSRYAERFDFIQFERREASAVRRFDSKIIALNTAIQLVSSFEYQFIGNLDADISFDPEYYRQITEFLNLNPEVGIAGGLPYEKHARNWVPFFVSAQWSVSGAVQMFRRDCFESIGGYLPLHHGGEDAIAEVMCRMHGWQVRTCRNSPVTHHRGISADGRNHLKAMFQKGLREYTIGYHPMFEFARSLWRLGEQPYLLGSCARMCGYVWGQIGSAKQDVPVDCKDYMRQEQLGRLRCKVSSLVKNRARNECQSL